MGDDFQGVVKAAEEANTLYDRLCQLVDEEKQRITALEVHGFLLHA